jgi:serine/threonine protein kinase/class 3 adenylate cyclase
VSLADYAASLLYFQLATNWQEDFVEFRGQDTYQTVSPLGEHRLWSAFRAVSSTNAPCELRLIHRTETGTEFLLRGLRLLQSAQHASLLRASDSDLNSPKPFIVLPASEPLLVHGHLRQNLSASQKMLQLKGLFEALAELHRLGMIAGGITMDQLRVTHEGVVILDVMSCWTMTSSGDDFEDDVTQLCSTALAFLECDSKTYEPHQISVFLCNSESADRPLLTASAVLERINGLLLNDSQVNVAAIHPSKGTDQTFIPELAVHSNQHSVPERLGRFQLYEQLGEGAVGAVFRAVDTINGTEVAIKILNERTAQNPATLRRLIKEARMLAKADSPFVARLIESNHDSGIHYLALEFVAGGTLTSVIRSGRPISETKALRIILDVARGLAVAHRESVFHRDIKPDNILLTRAGAHFVQSEHTGDDSPDLLAKLSDFGLARSMDHSESMAMTRDGAILGTPLYMSPEQCRGIAADARSDLYSLGATLFHLLAGRPPFPGDSHVVVMNAHCNEALPSLRQLCPGVSEACVIVVEKCLSKNADARYETAELLVADLERLLHGEPTSIGIHPQAPSSDGVDVFQHEFSCELKSSPEQLWPYVSHTDRINHALGLGSVSYTTHRHPERGVERIAEARVAGQKMSWQEHPYEWVEGRRLSVLREFSSGPFVWFMNIVELTPISGGGTRLTQTFRAVPKGWAGRMICRFELARRSPKAFKKVYQQIDEFLQRGAQAGADAFGAKAAITAGGKRRLEQRVEAVASAGTDPAVVETLRQFLENASDLEIARIRPLVFADRFQLPPDEVVRTCLLGAKEGLLLHLWDILCPSCRIPADVQETLASLKDHAYCPACDLKYDIDFASSVELIFRAHPEVRQAETKTYCIGGPAFSAHVVAQIRLAPGERFDLEVALSEGSYRLRGPQLPFTIDLTVSAGRGATRSEFSMLRPPLPGSVPVFRAGRQVMSLDNATGQSLLVKLERTAGRSRALTAAAASALPLFRDLFPNDVLAPGQIVSITSVTLLLADLCNASELYDAIGDGQAFGKIRSQLVHMDESVRVSGGAVVKLPGEGLLAVFQNTSAAVQAALRIMKQPSKQQLQRKVVINQGSAMVTTLNDRLDYFGATVSRTRQLLDMASPDELLMPARLALDEDIKPLLAEYHDQFILRELNLPHEVITLLACRVDP